jgi:hypothetical protein
MSEKFPQPGMKEDHDNMVYANQILVAAAEGQDSDRTNEIMEQTTEETRVWLQKWLKHTSDIGYRRANSLPSGNLDNTVSTKMAATALDELAVCNHFGLIPDIGAEIADTLLAVLTPQLESETPSP